MKVGSLGLIFLLVLGSSLALDARQISDEIRDFNFTGTTENACLLCQGYAAQAQSYIHQKENQKLIFNILQDTCSSLPSLEKQEQCMKLVGKYGPVFLVELMGAEPGSFCQHPDQCREVVYYGESFSLASCEVCQFVVSRVAALLKNPATQTKILEILKLACATTQALAPECILLVSSFGPLIIAGIQAFMEHGNLCEKIGACAAAPAPAFP